MPIYKRKWFHAGLIILAIGVFTYFHSGYTQKKYEAKYPEFAVSDRQQFLDNMNKPLVEPKEDEPLPKAKTKEEVEEYTSAVMVHGLYGTYRYAGIVISILGILCMLLSIKEPQVPTLEDEDTKNKT